MENELIKETLARLQRIEDAVRAPAKEYMDTVEASHFTSISAVQFEDWRSRGGGPRYIKMGRKVLYRVSDLREFVDRHAREALS